MDEWHLTLGDGCLVGSDGSIKEHLGKVELNYLKNKEKIIRLNNNCKQLQYDFRTRLILLGLGLLT